MLSRGARLAVWCIGLFLVASTIVPYKPGLPPNLKADEPAYFLMAMSLAHDRDLRCEPGELRRLFESFELEAHNLILMSDDNFKTVYYGKPYIYSLVAAPFVLAFGANGPVVLNMTLFVLCVVMGASFLSRHNPSGVALGFAAGFFVLSNVLSYVYWIHPEILLTTSITTSLYLVLHVRDEAGARHRLRALLSGAALAFAVYNKPMYGAIGLVPLASLVFRRRWGGAFSWVTGAVLSIGLIAGGSYALTGHPTAYLGTMRQGVNIRHPYGLPVTPQVLTSAAASMGGGDWRWILDKIYRPEPSFEFDLDVSYFLWGRHTGILVYSPFVGLTLLLFLRRWRRYPEGWVILFTQAQTAFFFLTAIAFNWHGGGGFVGNRYFVSLLPGFLFLVGEIRPRGLVVAGFGVGALLTGMLAIQPYGPIVPYPTLQAAARNTPMRFLPLEITLKKQIPGYRGVAHSGCWIEGRQDQFVVSQGEEIWLRGGTEVELRISTQEPIESLVVLVRSLASHNRIELNMDGAKAGLNFEQVDPRAPDTRRIVLKPEKTWLVWRDYTAWQHVHLLRVKSETGIQTRWFDPLGDDFYLGASLVVLGTEESDASDVYHAAITPLSPPVEALAGRRFALPLTVTNRSQSPWPLLGPSRVNLSYHWLSPDGAVVVPDGVRSKLGKFYLAAGATSEVIAADIIAPREPGSYLLELDLVYEMRSWFAERGSPTVRLPIEVRPVPADAPPDEVKIVERPAPKTRNW